MSYKALYRTYRPQTFSTVIGQQPIVKTLKNALIRNRIGHAYLFSGPRGTGKTTIAKIFAKTLNCSNPKDGESCGECDNCLAARNGNHPDIIEIDAASNNGVDEVRNLISDISYPPVLGKYKVYIIDEVHMMSSGAFNAFLKTIEEPPEYVIFILATTEPHKILETILSRCQQYDFKKVSYPLIQKNLEEIALKENIKLSPEAARLLAELSDGCVRDSLSYLDQAIAYSDSSIHESDLSEIFSIPSREDIQSIIRFLADQKVQEALDLLNELFNRGMDMNKLLDNFISILKDSFLESSATEEPELYIRELPSQKRWFFLNEALNIKPKTSFSDNLFQWIQVLFLKLSSGYSYESENTTGTDSQQKSEKRETAQESPTRLVLSDHDSYTEKNPIQTVTPSSSLKSFSDVSRETFIPLEVPNPAFHVNDEFIFNIFRSSTKDERMKDEKVWRKVQHYIENSHDAKLASSLNRSRILASSPDFLIIVLRDPHQVDEINEIQKNEGYGPLLHKVLGRAKSVIALSVEEANRLNSVFKSLSPVLNQPSTGTNGESSEPDQSDHQDEVFLKQFIPNLVIVDD